MATKKTRAKKVAAEAKPKPTPGVEIGRSGTDVWAGIISEEYVAELAGTRAMRTYDRMRKSDATVKAALLAVQLPIRRAQWFVNPASEDEKDIEIADFVQSALMEYQSITWDDFLRQALLSTTYGVMVFEKVFDVREINGVTRIYWKKFAPRLPKSILSWSMKDGSDGITQQVNSGKEAEIPMEKLLIFVNEKEGDNWWGNSMLRAAYKHWYMKSNLEKIDAIAHERQGLGVPSVKLPAGATAADRTAAENILGNMRANEEGYLIEPDGISVEFKDMKASGTKDASRAIDYHDRKITMAVLAQFLSLGSGASGSYALSQDHSALFLQSIEAIANGLSDVINKYAIPQLVDLNFDGVVHYPDLDFSGISRTDVDVITTSYQRAVQSGGIKPIDADEAYLRKIMGLPENDVEDESTDTTTDTTDVTNDLGLPEEAANTKATATEIETGVKNRLALFSSNAQRIDYLEKQIGAARSFKEKHPGMGAIEQVLCIKLSELKKKRFQEQNDFKGWRALTFAEKKVSLGSLQDFINKNEAALTDQASSVMKLATEDFINRLTTAVNKGNMQAIKDMEMKYWNDYKDVIKASIKKSFDFGKNNASREMDVKAPSNPQELAQQIDLIADTIATQHFYKVESEAKIAVTNQLVKFGEKEIKALAAAAAIMSSTASDIIKSTAAIVVADTINKGRALVFDRNAGKIHGLQRSEILDEVTCNFCLSMDGRIVEPGDSIAKQGTFHSNCRGIWVEILKDEAELPNISGVPDSLRERVGEAVNELVQPKNPIVRKDSLAAQAIKNKKK